MLFIVQRRRQGQLDYLQLSPFGISSAFQHFKGCLRPLQLHLQSTVSRSFVIKACLKDGKEKCFCVEEYASDRQFEHLHASMKLL